MWYSIKILIENYKILQLLFIEFSINCQYVVTCPTSVLSLFNQHYIFT
jgi:hypothetical protein